MTLRSGLALSAATALWLATSGPCHAQEAATKRRSGRPIQTPEGELRKTTVEDLAPHPSSRTGYTELWTYHVYLEGDVQVYINFSRANLGSFKGDVCGADLSIVGLEGNTYAVAREYPAENMRFDATKGRLAMHRNLWFEGELPKRQRVHYETRKKKVSYLVDLTLEEIEPGYSWGDGLFHFDDEELGIFVHVPYAKVSGSIAIDDPQAGVKTSREVRGTAYMDHTLLTTSAPKLLENGYRYIRHTAQGGYRVGFLVMPTSKFEAVPVGYGLEREPVTQAVRLLAPLELRVVSSESIDGTKLASELEVHFDPEQRLLLRRVENRQRLSIFDDLSGLVKWLARKFAGGELVMFRGEGQINTDDMHYSYFIVK